MTRALADATLNQREVTNFQTYVGTASPYNFNGLVRHYFLRRGSNVADIQVNLVAEGRAQAAEPRHRQARPRELLQPIASRYGARIKVAEVPPGPPVLQTLVAEIYGPTHEGQHRAGPADPRDLREDRRRGGRGLVRRGRPAEVAR